VAVTLSRTWAPDRPPERPARPWHRRRRLPQRRHPACCVAPLGGLWRARVRALFSRGARPGGRKLRPGLRNHPWMPIRWAGLPTWPGIRPSLGGGARRAAGQPAPLPDRCPS